jgi:ribosomal protein S18 acetylase RimI-like enzyme
MDNIVLHRVTLSDISQLQQISRQTFYETFSPVNTEENMRKYLDEELSIEKLSKELANQDSEFYFASSEKNVVGYLKLNFGKAQTELQEDKAIELERIYVLREFQGTGVGQFLYNYAIHIARQRDVDYLWLGVWEDNIRARNFYQKNGLVEFDKHIFKLGNDVQTDIMMKRAIRIATQTRE